MNKLENLIAQLCDADKREQDEQLKKVAGLVLIHNVADWYVTVTQEATA